MSSIINGIVATFIFLANLPFIVFLLIWAAVRLSSGKKKLAMERAMDVTTFFLVFSVSGMIDSIFKGSIGFWIIIFVILLLVGLFGNLQVRVRGQLDPKRLFRAVWRISFLLLSVLYVIFFIVGVIVSYKSM